MKISYLYARKLTLYFTGVYITKTLYRHEWFTGNTPLVKFMRNYIQDSSGVFSIDVDDVTDIKFVA